MKCRFLSIVAGAALSFVVVNAASATTLDEVKKKGFVQCGVNTGLLGFGATNDAGEWTGFDIDYCKAIAVAIFNDPAKVKYTPLNATERFTALQSGDIDVLTRNTTWTMARDTSQGLTFAAVNYYDGQGFMVRKSLGIASALELSGASICLQTGTTTELNLADYFKAHKMTYTLVAFQQLKEVEAAYDSGRCDALTTDASGLYAIRLTISKPGGPHHPARDHLQGAARPGRPPGRRPVVQHRQMGSLRASQCRGARRQPGQCRPDEDLGEPGRPPFARRRRHLRRRHRRRQRLGLQRHQDASETTTTFFSATSGRGRSCRSRAA